MDKKPKTVLLLGILVLLFCGTGYGDFGGLAISGKVGTLGLGGELTTGITTNINARVGLNMLDFDYDNEIEGVDYDIGFDFSSFSALLDWYIFEGSFRISGGLVSMKHELGLKKTEMSTHQNFAQWQIPDMEIFLMYLWLIWMENSKYGMTNIK